MCIYRDIIFASQGNLKWDRILELAGDHWELVLWSLMLYRYVYPAHTAYVPRSLWQGLLTRLSEAVARRTRMQSFEGA